jgi:hypothetical protein
MVKRAVLHGVLGAIVGFWLFAGCSAKISSSRVGGETNWLGTCRVDADCRTGAACLCGVCTKECVSNATCSAIATSECIEQGSATFDRACGSATTISGACLSSASGPVESRDAALDTSVGSPTNGRDAGPRTDGGNSSGSRDAGSVTTSSNRDASSTVVSGNFGNPDAGTGFPVDVPDGGTFPFCDNGALPDAAVLPPGVTLVHDYGATQGFDAAVATDSALFWMSGSTIHRLTLDGTETVVVDRSSPTAGTLLSRLAADSKYLYFAESVGPQAPLDPGRGLERIPLGDPTSSPTTIAPSTVIAAFTVSGNNLYYADGTSGHDELKRVPVIGGTPTTLVRDTWFEVLSVGVADGYVYYVLGGDFARLMRVPIDTVAPDTQTGMIKYSNLGADLVRLFPGPYTTLVSDGTTAFWLDFPNIVAMPATGRPTAIAQSPQLGSSGVYQIAASAGWIYWDYSPDCVGLYKSRSDGSDVTFIPGVVFPEVITVNSTNAYVFDQKGRVVSMPR